MKIKEAIASIEDGLYVLPAIQREFVWNTDQIVTLFDSLMRDYPISTFLFWQVKAKDVGKIRIEGKEYHPEDGDVMEFRFNV